MLIEELRWLVNIHSVVIANRAPKWCCVWTDYAVHWAYGGHSLGSMSGIAPASHVRRRGLWASKGLLPPARVAAAVDETSKPPQAAPRHAPRAGRQLWARCAQAQCDMHSRPGVSTKGRFVRCRAHFAAHASLGLPPSTSALLRTRWHTEIALERPEGRHRCYRSLAQRVAAFFVSGVLSLMTLRNIDERGHRQAGSVKDHGTCAISSATRRRRP